MVDFAYTGTPDKLKSLLEKIPEVGTPPRVDEKWLNSIGFSSGSDKSIVRVLKFIGLVDQSGNPTERWRRYRNKSQSRQVLAEGILEGYRDLFGTYPQAAQKSDEDLRAFFSTRTSAGIQVTNRTVATFKTLCELADFDTCPAGAVDSGRSTPPRQMEPHDTVTTQAVQSPEHCVAVNINIQLTLPETTDETVYEKLFAAMKKHLLS